MKNHVYYSVIIVLLMIFLSCDSVPLTAPSGSSIVIIANPDRVELDTGESIITVIVTDKDGNPVTNGTVVYFSTSMGSLKHQMIETVNGKGDNIFYAGHVPGQAHIRAYSGAADAADVYVQIGIDRATVITVQAQPDVISHGGSSLIVCTLWDDDNNTVPGQAVIFSAQYGSMHSEGTVLHTDDNGQVFDTVTADGDFLPPYIITVTAQSGYLNKSVNVEVVN